MFVTKDTQPHFERLRQVLPEVAIRLPFAQGKHLVETRTQEDEPNLRVQKEDLSFDLYYHQSARKEAHKWFDAIKSEHIQGIYIYGIGLGYYYEPLSQWLQEKKERYAVFIEDDIAMFFHFLNGPYAERILSDEQVDIVYLNEDVDIEAWADQFTWNFPGTEVVFTGLVSYQRYKERQFHGYRLPVIRHSISNGAVFSEILQDKGLPYFVNFYHNLLHLKEAHLGNQLFSKFNNVPAIICGAGPSLNKNIHLLKDIKESALIVAGGSAVNALNRHHIHSHFCAGVDPTLEERKRFLNQDAFSTPTLYVNRLCYLATQLIQGPKLMMVGSKGGYTIQKWFEDVFGIEEDLDWSGYSVLTFCTQVASLLGCSPIIFVGVDLAASNEQLYASGVLRNSNVNEEWNFESNSWLGAVKKQDIYGNEVNTQWKWIVETQWLSNFAQKHPKQTFINATEGGIGIEGVQNLSLQKVIDKHCSRKLDLSNRVQCCIQNCTIVSKNENDAYALFEEMEESLIRCEKLCNKLEDAVRVHLFAEIGTKCLQPLQEVQKRIFYQADNVEPGSAEYLRIAREATQLQKHMQAVLELCENIMKSMESVRERVEVVEEVPREIWETLEGEFAYRYLLCDIDRVLLVKMLRKKKRLLGTSEEDIFARIGKETALAEMELQRLSQLKSAIETHKTLCKNLPRQS